MQYKVDFDFIAENFTLILPPKTNCAAAFCLMRRRQTRIPFFIFAIRRIGMSFWCCFFRGLRDFFLNVRCTWRRRSELYVLQNWHRTLD